MKTYNPIRLYMVWWHRRWAKNALIDAREWFMYFDPDWARYHWQLAMNHVRKARKWERN